MENENTKNDLLNEIVNLSNSNFDLMLDTSKYKNIVNKNEKNNKKHSFKSFNSTKIPYFNSDQAIKDNINQNSNDKNIKEDLNLENNDKIIEEKDDKKGDILDDNNNLFDEADNILNNFTKKLESRENIKTNLIINNDKVNIINESSSNNIENKMNSMKEENENKNNDINGIHSNNDKNDINNNNMVKENKLENNVNNNNELVLSNLESCKYNKEENKKCFDSIFDMLDFDKNIGMKNKFISSKELNIPKNFENINNYKKEINSIEENKEEMSSDKVSNSSDIDDKEKENGEENNNNKENNENNDNKNKPIEIEKINNKIGNDTIKGENNENNNEINEIEIKNNENNENNVNNENNKNNKNIENNDNLNINKIIDENKNNENIENTKESIINIIIDSTNTNNESNEVHNKTDFNKNNKENSNINQDQNNNNISNIVDEKKGEIEEPKIELTGLKIDLVQKTENFTFLKSKNKSELRQYLINNIYEDRKSENQKKNKNMYEIIELFPKNKLLTDFFNQKITSIYLDTEEFIYCGEEKGNLLIYNLKDEKLIKQLDNPFIYETKKIPTFPRINCISSDDQFIIAGYEKGQFAIFLKNEKKPVKTKLYDAFQEISQHNIIETKIYSKKKNSMLIYSCDDQENIYRTKVIKNKIFRNKVYTNRITGSLKNVNKKEPYYHLEINPFWYKCIGVVNNRGVHLYIIKKCKKDIIFKWNNLDEDNAFLSFFFSHKKEEKNKFFISNMNRINIFEINNNYNGVAQQNLIILKDNIIQIGEFINDLLYAFEQKNIIQLINYKNQNNNKIYNNEISNENNEYGFIDTITINNNNNDIIKDNDEENFVFLNKYKNFLCSKNGTILMYNKNNILYLKTLSLYDGTSKIYNSIVLVQNLEKWDILFKIGRDIYKNKHPVWKIEHMNKFNDIYINYVKSFLSYLIIQLGNNNNKNDEFNNIIKHFKNLIEFLIDAEFYNFIIGEKNNLYSIFVNSKLEDLYFYLLEPYIIEDTFMTMNNLPNSFINNLMDIFLNKKNKESKFIKMNKSWLSELLLHFNIKKYIEKGKNSGLLENIKENYLINTIIYFILNYNSNEIFINNLIDYNTPLNLLIKILQSNIKKVQKNENKDKNIFIINFDNNELFKKENRYKDEIIYSTDYIRIKIIWYIYIILKNKILNGNDTQDKANEHKKSLFIKEILKIPLDKELFNNIVVGNNNIEDGVHNCLDREFIHIIHIIFENDIISKYSDFTKEEICQKLINLYEKRKESQISLNILLIKSMINDKGIEISNEIKLNLVLFFMENNCVNADIYPEIKDIKFQDNLIEILKSIDSFTFDDSEKLVKLVNNCQNNYNKLVTYIKTNFKY